MYGVSHGDDISFVMQTLGVLIPNTTPAKIELSETIGDYWCVVWHIRLYARRSPRLASRINFAYNLDPNPKSGPKRRHSYVSPA